MISLRALVRGLCCCLCLLPLGSQANAQNTDKTILGYYPFWANFRKETAFADVRAEYLTHLVYFKLAINEDGSLDTHDYFMDYAQVQGVVDGQIKRGSYQAIELLKDRNPNLKVLFSVGGWDGSTYLSSIAASPEKIQTFVDSTLEIIERFGFDGIEIDWRYPVIGGDTRTLKDSKDSENYPKLLQALRQACKQCSLQVTVPVFSYFRPNWHFDQLEPLVDLFIPLTSEYSGGWDRRTSHMSPLADNPAHPTANIRSSFDELVIEGLPLDKTVFKIGAVGTTWQGVESSNHGLFQDSKGPALGTWDNNQTGATGITAYREVLEFLKDPEYQLHWDEHVGAHSLYHPKDKKFISFESLASLDKKLALTQELNLAGIAIWDLPSDSKGSDSLLFHSYQFYHSYLAAWSKIKTLLQSLAPWILGASLGALMALVWRLRLAKRRRAKHERGQRQELLANVSTLPGHLDQILFLTRTPPQSIAKRLTPQQQRQLHYLAALSAQMQYQLSPMTQALPSHDSGSVIYLGSDRRSADRRTSNNAETESQNPSGSQDLTALTEFTGLIGQQCNLEKMMETLFEFLSQDGRIKGLCLSQEGSIQKSSGQIDLEAAAPDNTTDDHFCVSSDRKQAWVAGNQLVEQQLMIAFAGELSATEEAYFRALAQQLMFARAQLRELTRQPQLLSEIYAIAKHGEQLLFIKGEKGYSGVYGDDSSEPTYIYMRLRALRQYFPERLVPVHRSYLINPERVTGVIKTGSNYALEIGDHQVPLARSYCIKIKRQFPHWFEAKAA